MAGMAKNGRFLTRDILESDYSINIGHDADGKIVISTGLKTIDKVADIDYGFLRNVDAWTELPDVSDFSVAAAKGYIGKVVMYHIGNIVIIEPSVFFCYVSHKRFSSF